jgi:multiple sugar transport system ATP-binding protein
VTHDQIEALTLSDRIVVMNEGSVMQEGAPYDVYHHPANLFVAEFIGDPRVNLFTGTLTAEQQLDCGDLTLPVGNCPATKSGKLVASVRPESIKVSYDAKDDWLEVKVENVQPTGADTILQVYAGQTPITLLQPGFVTLEVGAPLWIDFDLAALNFFDPETKNNLAAA